MPRRVYWRQPALVNATRGGRPRTSNVFAHNVLDDTWASRLASWSTDRAVAEGFAGKNGVTLRTTIEAMQARGVNMLELRDAYDEAEILFEGRIGGLQVTQPRRFVRLRWMRSWRRSAMAARIPSCARAWPRCGHTRVLLTLSAGRRRTLSARLLR